MPCNKQPHSRAHCSRPTFLFCYTISEIATVGSGPQRRCFHLLEIASFSCRTRSLPSNLCSGRIGLCVPLARVSNRKRKHEMSAVFQLFFFFGNSLRLLFSCSRSSHILTLLDCASSLACLPLSVLKKVVQASIITIIMADIREYQVSVPSAAIKELQQKLALSKFPDDIDSDDREYSAPIADVKPIAKYWHEEFNWASFEKWMKEFPHFEATMSL